MIIKVNRLSKSIDTIKKERIGLKKERKKERHFFFSKRNIKGCRKFKRRFTNLRELKFFFFLFYLRVRLEFAVIRYIGIF